MATTTCETCGNDYDKAFYVHIAGESHAFDCFECAINMLAPQCAHCGCRVIGHGVEQDDTMYCCAHCARHAPQGAAGRTRARPSAG